MAAQKQTYECFVCKKNGFEERVVLGGKDSNGKTIYFESDGVSPHYHKGKAASSTAAAGMSDAAAEKLAESITSLADALKSVTIVVSKGMEEPQ